MKFTTQLAIGLVCALWATPAHSLFCGVKSQTHNVNTLALASRALSAGVRPSTIWENYGWHYANDNKWRCEIDDTSAKLKPIPTGRDVFILSELLHHSELYKAYPSLASVRVRFRTSAFAGTWDGKVLTLAREQRGIARLLLPTLLHEVQHVIQDLEGFRYARNFPVWERYDLRRGEIEAEAVEARLGLSAEQRRATNPHILIDAQSK